MFEIPS